ncbi:hypothetical protein HYC85_004014 [Camellia sinensis]|uniref:DUF4283 domain-containing protein n=1 Tax=Camellia sinensis TaxID=4442 RepID=A0A7J7HVV2_CAMSI|nr:hypothetical protein HYC85_004014 [Camellia sinensis]
MSCVEGLVDVASMDSQTKAEMVKSHSSNGLGKSFSHNVISMPWSGLFKSEIAKKKVAKSLKRYLVGYENDQLQIPLEISKIRFKQWEHALVGYFINRKLYFFQVKTWAYKLWKENLEEIVTLDNGYFVFKIKDEEALKSILDAGPYYIGSKLIVIKKWHPGMTLTKNVFSSVPI